MKKSGKVQFSNKSCFYRCNLNAANFAGTKLSGVLFAHMNLSSVDWGDADFKGADFIDVSFDGANLRTVKNISNAKFNKVYYLDISEQDRNQIKNEISIAKTIGGDFKNVISKLEYFSNTKNTIFPKNFNPSKEMINSWEIYRKNSMSFNIFLLNADRKKKIKSLSK